MRASRPKEKNRQDRDRRYNHSAEGQARYKRYNRSVKGRMRHSRYSRSTKGRARWARSLRIGRDKMLTAVFLYDLGVSTRRIGELIGADHSAVVRSLNLVGRYGPARAWREVEQALKECERR